MEVVRKFNQTFVVRTDPDEIAEVWSNAGNDLETAPEQLITFTGTDGEDGLMWGTWEEMWVEYGLVQDLNPVELLKLLVDEVSQPREECRLDPNEKDDLITMVSNFWVK